MDLSDLLEPERIRCHCNVQSKKRTLQTVAEILGESLRAKHQATSANCSESISDDTEKTAAKNGLTVPSIKTKKSRKVLDKSEPEPDTLSDMAILDALISRERLGSTGLGHGVGLPHSRVSCIQEPIAAFVTLDTGVDYESTDGQAVDLVLGLLVPEHCNDEHLKILAQLARRFSDETLRSQLRNFEEPERLYQHLLSLAPANS
ncbi:MAG: PTS system nitrogen regulatory IIA component [Granulosicoccus sp.]|jgi:PTS system nitrogen regulatory IIA component